MCLGSLFVFFVERRKGLEKRELRKGRSREEERIKYQKAKGYSLGM